MFLSRVSFLNKTWSFVEEFVNQTIGYYFVHIDYRMHFDASFSFAVCRHSSCAFENILKQADSCAVENFDLLIDYMFNSAVQDKMCIVSGASRCIYCRINPNSNVCWHRTRWYDKTNALISI